MVYIVAQRGGGRRRSRGRLGRHRGALRGAGVICIRARLARYAGGGTRGIRILPD